MYTNQSKKINQKYFMNLALNQARKNLGNTKDNPSVGCIITNKNNVISAGCTSIDGRPHAEINSINLSKSNLKNSNLYVTLEPCSHYGKTPPCVKKIIDKKIKKVFFSIKDPDIRSHNKSKKILLNHRIKVKSGLLSDKIKRFYKSYIKYKKESLPFVTLKLAVSRDYFTISKKKKWITNEFSRGRVHLMRSNHDCIITSSNTIISDNPRLTCRIKGLANLSPARIIFDKKLRIPIKSRFAKDARLYNSIIFYNKINKKKLSLLKKSFIKTFRIPLDLNGELNLNECLKKVKQLGFSRILVESGLKLTRSFLTNKLVDELNLFISEKRLNINGKGNIRKYLNPFLTNKKRKVEKVNLLGDKLISYKLK